MNELELKELPVPRLQLKCIKLGEDYKRRVWEYDLVYKHFTGDVVYISMGKTNCEGGKGNIPVYEDGRLDLPHRDGAHIKNEALQLKLPAYAICEHVIEKIDLTEFIKSFPEKVIV